MTHLRPTVRRCSSVLMLMLTLIAAGACGGSDNKATATATTAATAARPDPRQLLNDSATTLEQAKSFHFVLEHERGSTPIVFSLQMNRAEGDVVRPDKLQADIDATALGQKVKIKLVSVGDKAKISNPINPKSFQDLPSGTRVSDVFDPAAGASAALRNAQNPQITGEDTIDGKKVWVITGDVDAGSLTALTALAEKGNTVHGTAWIGQDTKEAYRIRLDGPLGKDDTKDVVRVLTISKYNQNIDITPVP
jgi:hypothetical protein